MINTLDNKLHEIEVKKSPLWFERIKISEFNVGYGIYIYTKINN